MVQVLEDNSPQSQRFAAATKLFQSLGGGAEALKGHLDENSTRQALVKRFGEAFGKIKDPRARELMIKGALDKEETDAKRTAETTQLKQHYPELVKRFGQQEADVLMALPSTGAQTDYISHLLKQEARNKGFGEEFGGEEEPEETLPGEEPPPKPKKTPIIDYDKGLTPEERARREDKRYSINLPLYTDSVNKKRAAQTQQEELAVLADLSPRISALERINIDPRTGDLILPVAASEDAQRYVKTINDFTRTAKESYGARVTNFDLTQFLKRLPTLANSAEGRRQIIEQLQIFNELDMAHEQALQDAFNSHGGVRKIDFDKAIERADKSVEKVLKGAKSRLANIGSNQNKTYKEEVEGFKKLTPKGHVAVRKADGTMGDIPKERLAEFLKIEGNEVL